MHMVNTCQNVLRQ